MKTIKLAAEDVSVELSHATIVAIPLPVMVTEVMYEAEPGLLSAIVRLDVAAAAPVAVVPP